MLQTHQIPQNKQSCQQQQQQQRGIVIRMYKKDFIKREIEVFHNIYKKPFNYFQHCLFYITRMIYKLQYKVSCLINTRKETSLIIQIRY